MTDLDRRIAQFQNMAQADPENEMAHFSLAQALVQAGRHAEAAESYIRCTELAPGMSKAYQLAAESMLKAGDKDRAAQFAVRGYTIAVERGDLLPKNALADLLRQLGREVPEVAAKGGAKKDGISLLGGDAASGPRPDPASFPPGTFIDHKTGRPGTKMPRPPFRGPLGLWIHEHISQETFNAWIGQGTKVINELRLDLSRDQDSEVYDQHMREFLGIDDALHEQITSSNA
ncbi:MAG: Fe(2+)-trafficking protein [Phycisphaeraceae bacterium]|nr:Fe(2+)-trafficking protein [Phycisphaeraceae bacterium]